MTQTDGRACGNIAVALDLFGRRGGLEEERCQDLAGRMVEALDRVSPAGQEMVVKILAGWLGSQPQGSPAAVALVGVAGKALARAASSSSSAVHGAGLALAEKVLERECPPELEEDCRGLVQACFAMKMRTTGCRRCACRGTRPWLCSTRRCRC